MVGSTKGVENKTARKFIGFIEEFRKLDANMQVQQISLFLNVVAMPDLTIQEYAKRTGLGVGGPISRNLDGLSETKRVSKKDPKTGEAVVEMVPGHGLIEVYEDPVDRRYKRVKPTPRGIRVYNSLIQLLGS